MTFQALRSLSLAGVFSHLLVASSHEKSNKCTSLRITGPCYRGVWMCIAGVWDLQTTSFEIPWFLGFKIFTPCFYIVVFYIGSVFFWWYWFYCYPEKWWKDGIQFSLAHKFECLNHFKCYIRSQKQTRKPTFHDLDQRFSFWDIFQVAAFSYREQV